MSMWMHMKTGGKYEIVTEAMIEATLEKVVVYRNLENHMVWVRPYDEFHDGRFVRIG